MNDANDRQNGPITADLSGRQLGDYRLLRRLGRGAMAEVYLAEQCSLNRQVAFKVLKRDLATDQTYIQRFQREAQAAASLVHANIVQIHEVGCIDGVYFIAQEYVQGLNLRQWMARNGTLDLRMALVIMRQVSAALAKAAEQGIVHRDIKPENIMITRSGEVKVADFGLARVPRVGDAVDLTQAGMTLGTPLYMSPEQVEGKPLDPRSDLYSFGVTCYQMLAGGPPFEGETALSVAVQHLKKQPEALENVRPDMPPALCRIVHKMLSKGPENRYQSAGELLRDLRLVQLEHLDEPWPEELPGFETTGLDVATSLTETTQRLGSLMKSASRARIGRHWWILWTAGAIAAFVLGGVLAYGTIREEPLLGQAPKVDKQQNVYDQYAYATHVGTEDAWQAVVDYFPEGNATYVNSAKKQLAWIYLVQHRNYEKALEVFGEFGSRETADRKLRAFGLAGQYSVWVRKGEYERAAEVLLELLLVRDGLEPGWMSQTFGQAYSKARRERPGRVPEPEFQKWLEELNQSDEPDQEGGQTD